MPTLPSLLSPETHIFLFLLELGYNLTVPVASLSLYTLPFKGGCGTSKGDCWLPVDTLHFQALMAHAHLQSLLLESPILCLGPGCSPLMKLLHRIPVAAFLGAEAVRVNGTVSEKHVGMWVIPSRIFIFSDMEGHDGTHP